ncbi:MAG: copper oxidase, partial [Gemmatimonadetes bacterium]|nr:copper oxidase [Gemmatimonadota bacterium]
MTIPKYVNRLTKPPVHVPTSLTFDQTTGRFALTYTVTAKAFRQQLLPPGFPSTTVYGYGGLVNFNESNEFPDLRFAFTTPGPTFEAVRDQRIFVHY